MRYREFTAPDIVLNTLNALSQLILRTTNTPTDFNCFPLALMKCIVLCVGEQVSLTAKGCVFIYREEGINTKALTDDFFFYRSKQKEPSPWQSAASVWVSLPCLSW